MSFFRIILLSLIPALCIGVPASAQTRIDCIPVKDREYRILDYSVQEPAGKDAPAEPIVEEFGVMYNISQMPAGYEIATALKSFAMENGIDGVVIVSDFDAGPDGVVAAVQKTSDGKTVLIVSNNLTSHPGMIVKVLQGVTEAQEIQARELRSVVKVEQNDERWQAQVAKQVKKGVEQLTGGATGTSIDYDKVAVEETGRPFGELFGDDKMTMEIKQHGPYDIEIRPLAEPITSVPGILAHFVLEVVYKNPEEAYPEKLYIGDDGRLYSCK